MSILTQNPPLILRFTCLPYSELPMPPYLLNPQLTPIPPNQQGAATDFPLTASIPASQTCTGTVAGQDNVCLVRCQNAARAGPFGGVVPVQMVGAGTGAGTGNGNGNGNGTDTGAAAGANAQARRRRWGLARSINKARRAISLKEDLQDPELRAELLEEGELDE